MPSDPPVSIFLCETRRGIELPLLSVRLLGSTRENADYAGLSGTGYGHVVTSPVLTTGSIAVFHADALEALRTLPDEFVDSIVTDPPAGISFMGKGWDRDKGGRSAWVEWLAEIMKEAHRVLKPGGYALVWALPRTSHWTATALEDAGFEIRDCVVHLFGSGFPKSHDIRKAIDKAAGADDAKQWDGWGTALKPGSEHWWLVRKPFPGTVASNVLAHGVGGINVDGCRTTALTPDEVARSGKSTNGGIYGEFAPVDWKSDGKPHPGRWPTNLVMTHSASCDDGGECTDDCPVGELDRQSGHLSSGGPSKRPYPGQRVDTTVFDIHMDRTVTGYPDSGGASRFYPIFRYQAKAPARERPKVDGVTHPTAKSRDLMRWLCRLVTPTDGTVLDMFAGSGTTLEAGRMEGFRVIGIESEADYLPLIAERLGRLPADES
jgi:hypothetical protein